MEVEVAYLTGISLICVDKELHRPLIGEKCQLAAGWNDCLRIRCEFTMIPGITAARAHSTILTQDQSETELGLVG